MFITQLMMVPPEVINTIFYVSIGIECLMLAQIAIGEGGLHKYIFDFDPKVNWIVFIFLLTSIGYNTWWVSRIIETPHPFTFSLVINFFFSLYIYLFIRKGTWA